jgi:hypothetical protein
MSTRYAVLVLVLLVVLAPAAMAQKITPEQVFALGFESKQKAAFDKGEIISTGTKELSDKELALFMAVMVPAPMDKVVAFSSSGANMKVNKDLLAHGTLEGDDVKGFLAGAKWEGAELSEIDKLVAVKAGSVFNLSAAEMGRFAALHKKFAKGCSKDAACSKAVMDEYRSVLEGRLKAYQTGGLAAVDGYTRGSKSAEPSEEMKKASEAMSLTKETYPEVYNAMLNYPKGDQSKIESTFLWLKQTVQDRPTFILSHRMVFQDETLVLRLERQFYVGQSYNSLQIAIGLFPSGEKTTLFYLNRTSTDQVAGFMSGTRHGVGRKMMEKEVRKLFDAALAAVSK